MSYRKAALDVLGETDRDDSPLMQALIFVLVDIAEHLEYLVDGQ